MLKLVQAVGSHGIVIAWRCVGGHRLQEGLQVIDGESV